MKNLFKKKKNFFLGAKYLLRIPICDLSKMKNSENVILTDKYPKIS